MKKVYKLLIALSLCAVMALNLAACGGGSDDVAYKDDFDPNKDYNITFFGWGDASEQNIFKRVIQDFMVEYPNIKVEYRATTSGAYMNALVGEINELPDVFYLPDTEFLQWAASGRLLNIDGGVSQEKLDTVWDHAVDKYYYNKETYKLGYSEGAGLYGLAKDLGPYTLAYNKKLANQLIAANNLQNDAEVAGLFSGEPQTFEAFSSALSKLLKNKTNSNLYGIPYYELEHAVYSNNANFFNDSATTSQLTSTAFVDAIQFIADLATDGIMPMGIQTDNAYEKFLKGDSILTFMGPWDCAGWWELEDFEFDIIPVPYGPGPDRAYNTADDGMSTAFTGSMSYSIANATIDRGTAGASLRLAEYLCTNEKAQRRFYSLGQSIPNLKDMAYNEYIPNSMGILEGRQLMPANRQLFIDIADGFKDGNDKIGGKVRVLYYTYYSDWRQSLEDELYKQGVWENKKTAKEVLEGYNSRFQEQLNTMQTDLRG